MLAGPPRLVNKPDQSKPPQAHSYSLVIWPFAVLLMAANLAPADDGSASLTPVPANGSGE